MTYIARNVCPACGFRWETCNYSDLRSPVVRASEICPACRHRLYPQRSHEERLTIIRAGQVVDREPAV